MEMAIRLEYEMGDDELDDDDKWMLEEDVDHLLSRPGYEQHNWLEEIRMAREEYKTNHDQEAISLSDAPD